MTETVHTPESVPGNTDEEQEHEEDSDGSLEEMIVDRSKKGKLTLQDKRRYRIADKFYYNLAFSLRQSAPT